MKKILVPTDFSEQAGYAIEFAGQLGRKLNAELTLLHVVVDATLPSVHYTGEVALPDMQDRLFVLKLIERGKEQMGELVKDPALKDVKVRTEIHVGDIYYGVKEVIKEKEIDLIVMGTKGSGGFEEFLIGSNAERIVRHAPCPVITIHEKVKKFSLENIVYANSLEEPDHSCTPVLLEIINAYNAHVDVVRINTPNNFRPDHESLPKLRELSEKIGFPEYHVHVYNDSSEEAGILNFSQMKNADLIAMATHGRTGLAHLLSGSLAESVVNHTLKPVLTFIMEK